MQPEILHTSVSKIWLREDDILHLEYLPGTHLGLEESKLVIANLGKASNGRRLRCFIHATGLRSVSREAREYFAASQAILIGAMLTGSSISRVLGNFFLTVNKPVVPLRMFTSEPKAIEWLKTNQELE